MKFEGIQPNCSETVIRLKKEDYSRLSSEIMSEAWSMSEPPEGYSSMRPLPDTECIYFYQHCGDRIQDFLEANRIAYDIEAPFQPRSENWDELEPTEEELSARSDRDGGGGQFYRRKPYDN